MNIKKLDEQIALLTKITEALLKEAPKKEKYSDAFLKLSKKSTDFRLPTFQQMYDDAKKAKNAAQLGTTSRGYFGLIKEIEEQILLVYNDSKRFNQDFYISLFRQLFRFKELMLAGITLEPVDPSFDSDDADRNKIYGPGARFPTTAQEMGRRIYGSREEAEKEYKKAKDLHRSKIGINKAMSPSEEKALNDDFENFTGKTIPKKLEYDPDHIRAKEIVENIAKDLNDLDPASTEVEAAVNNVEEILSQDELFELENYLEKIEEDQAEGMFIPHPDFNPNDPNSPGYKEAMEEEEKIVDMPALNKLTEPQRIAIAASLIRKRGIENLKRKEAYRNRTPKEILADQVKRQKDKEEKEQRILDLINTRKDMTPDEIMKVIQDEYNLDPVSMSKKQTFDKIGMISLAMKTAESSDDKKTLKSAVATIRQRLQKDFAKTKFLQHDSEEIADLTGLLAEIYFVVMDNVFNHTENRIELVVNDELKKYKSEVQSDEEAKKIIEQLKDKSSFDAISAYYNQQEMASELAVEVAKIDDMDQEERFDLQAKISAFMKEKSQAESLRAMLEGFTGLRHLATSSTYDFYAKNVWAKAEEELKAAIKTYCSANGIPEEIMTSKSIADKITYYAMGRTYFKELEGHPMSTRSPEQIKQFAYDLIGHRLGSSRGASIPKQVGKTKGFEDYEMSLEEGKALAQDCISEEGIIGSVINRIFAPNYAESGLVDEVKEFYRTRGPAYLFSKVYEGMLYGAFYRKNAMAIELPDAFKKKWMNKASAFYDLINEESTPKNKLRDELIELIGE